MYNNRNSRGTRSSSRPGRKLFNKHSRSRGPQRRGRRDESMNPLMFVNKAVFPKEIDNFKPEHSFQDFEIDSRVKQNIKAKGYVDPTPIQDKAIPHILKGTDVVGIANTGTGKTAAFLIPLINKVCLEPKENILIVVPTRELAMQINQELKGFTMDMKIFSVCCVGGVSARQQIYDLRYRNNFIIGTPGRLKDLIERGNIRLAEFNTIVLDEADRMLDMGFIHDMRFIMAEMPKNRHTLFFSATISRDIDRLINDFLHNPIRISIKTRDTSANVDQDILKINRGEDKLDKLSELLKQPEFHKVLVFARTKHGAERLSKNLILKGYKAESIHGNKIQSRRQKALDMFKRRMVQVLVATDVVARGLDIDDISHVINYDLPASYDDYIHRIGRTGRANKRGKALTFIES